MIVSYEASDLLRRCLDNLPLAGREVVVVENGSGNGVEPIRRRFPGVELIHPRRNLGFGVAANLGVERTHGRWILLLNPDCWPERGAIDRLLAFAEADPRLGAVGPQLLAPDGRPSRSAIHPPLSAARLAIWAAIPHAVSRAYGYARRGGEEVRRTGLGETEFLMAAALLVRREAFEAVGGFDPSFFMYGEDADLCIRLRQASWRLALCPESRFVHVGGGSTGSDPVGAYRELLRSMLRLVAKHRGGAAAERARRLLLPVLRLQTLRGDEERHRRAAEWLAAGTAAELLADGAR